MVLYETVPEWLTKFYNICKTERDNFWNNRGKPAEDYFYNDREETGTPYTRNQINKIMSTTNIPVSFNYIYPAVEQKLAITIASKPSFKLVPLDDRAKAHAQILDKAKHHVLYNAEANSQIEEMQKCTLITGIGHIECDEKNFYQPGEFNTTVVFRHPETILLDPNSRNKHNEDMRGYFYELEITKEEANRLYGELFELISAMLSEEKGEEVIINANSFAKTGYGGINRVVGEASETVWFRRFRDKVLTKAYYIIDPKEGIKKVFQENFTPDVWEMLVGAKGENIAEIEENIFTRKWIILGDKVVWQEVEFYTEYPLKTNYFEWGGKPYRSYGMVHWIYSTQEAHDKFLQLLIFNGIRLNNPQRKAPVGWATPEMKKEYETKGNDPTYILEYNPVVIDGKPFVLEYEQVPQLSNFYPMMLQDAKAAIEYNTGINPMVYGDPQGGKVEVFSSLQQYTTAAMQRINLAVSHLNQTMQNLGNVVLQSILHNIRPDVHYPFFDEKGKQNEIMILRDIMQDFKLARYKIVSIPTEATPTQRNMMAQELMKISQSTADPVKRDIYVEGAFELSDMRGFDEIRDKTETAKQLQGQLASMEEELERMIENYKQVENRMLIAQANETRARKETEIIVEAEKAKLEIEIEKLKEQLKDAKKPTQEKK